MSKTKYVGKLWNARSSKSRRHSFLDGLALLLNGSNKCTSVYPLLKEKKILITRNKPLKHYDKIYFDEFCRLIKEYSQHCLTSNEHDMNKIYLLLESIIFEYNKNRCIKRITDDLFDDVVSNLKKLSNVDVDNLSQEITCDKLKKGSTDYYHVKEKNRSLKEYILKLFNWINYITSNRHAIKNNKNNVEPEIILKFQVIGEFLYNCEIFRSILSKADSINNVSINNDSIKYDSINNDSFSNDSISNNAERILYYLDRVSAHHRSLNSILNTLEKNKSEYGEIYKNIDWHFIKPIKEIIRLKTIPSSSFDKILLACGLADNETKKEFQDKFIQNKFNSYDSNLKLSTCLHSEIRMIDYLIEQNIKEVHDKDVEIGISKLPCYLCSLCIEKLNIR
ncbi:unnamed protein product [Rotaria sp. Silwood2]|nr:unnamed protein product [Rotaria sp. Silwood2]